MASLGHSELTVDEDRTSVLLENVSYDAKYESSIHSFLYIYAALGWHINITLPEMTLDKICDMIETKWNTT